MSRLLKPSMKVIFGLKLETDGSRKLRMRRERGNNRRLWFTWRSTAISRSSAADTRSASATHFVFFSMINYFQRWVWTSETRCLSLSNRHNFLYTETTWKSVGYSIFLLISMMVVFLSFLKLESIDVWKYCILPRPYVLFLKVEIAKTVWTFPWSWKQLGYEILCSHNAWAPCWVCMPVLEQRVDSSPAVT